MTERGILALIGGTTSAQVFTLLLAPALTRIYEPEHFGMLAAFSALVSIIAPVSALRYEAAIPLARGARNAVVLLLLSIAITAAIAALTGVVLVILHFAPVGYHLLDFWAAVALPIGVLGVGAYTAASGWAIRQRDYTGVARTRVVQTIAQGISQAGLGVLGAGGPGLISSFIVGQALGCVRLLRSAIPLAISVLKSLMPGTVGRLARSYKVFPLLGAPSALVMLVALELPPLLIVALFGHAEAGFFALAYRLMVTPAKMIASSIGQVYQAELSRLVRERTRDVSALYGVFLKRLILGGLVVFIPAAILAPIAAELVLGGEWRQVGRYVQVLSPMLLLQFIVSPVSQTTVVLRKQSSELALNLVRLVAVGLAFGVGYVLGLTALQGVAVYSAVMCMIYLIHLGVYSRIVRGFTTDTVPEPALNH